MSVHRRRNKTFPLPLTEISSATLGKFGRHTCAWPPPPASHRKSACADRKPHAYVGSSINLQDSPFIVLLSIFVCWPCPFCSFQLSLSVLTSSDPVTPTMAFSSHQLCACAVWKSQNIISSCEILSWTLTSTLKSLFRPLFSPYSNLLHWLISYLNSYTICYECVITVVTLLFCTVLERTWPL